MYFKAVWDNCVFDESESLERLKASAINVDPSLRRFAFDIVQVESPDTDPRDGVLVCRWDGTQYIDEV